MVIPSSRTSPARKCPQISGSPWPLEWGERASHREIGTPAGRSSGTSSPALRNRTRGRTSRSCKLNERLGYPTRKPLALLKRILAASSQPSEVVLDAFCGCGTTIDAAQELGRHWIGIDVTHLAVGLIKHRLADRYGPEIAGTYRVVGKRTTVDGARFLSRARTRSSFSGMGARPRGCPHRGG